MSTPNVQTGCKVGVVYAGMVLRADYSNRKFVEILEGAGAVVRTVNLFEGQAVKQPTLCSLPPQWRGADAEAETLARIVARLNHRDICSAFRTAACKLYDEDRCDRVYFVGKGLGGVYALRTAGILDVDGVFVFYPHLTLPGKVEWSGLFNPELCTIDCPVHIWQGEQDTKLSQQQVVKGNHRGREFMVDVWNANELATVTVHALPGIGHAFMDERVNLFHGLSIQNPFYHRQAAEDATRQLVDLLNITLPSLR